MNFEGHAVPAAVRVYAYKGAQAETVSFARYCCRSEMVQTRIAQEYSCTNSWEFAGHAVLHALCKQRPSPLHAAAAALRLAINAPALGHVPHP